MTAFKPSKFAFYESSPKLERLFCCFRRKISGHFALSYDVQANILILEVTAYAPWQLDTQLALRRRLRTTCPECRVALVVDEVHERPLADKVRRAKKDGLIDGFIYGSVSSAYLSAVIDTL